MLKKILKRIFPLPAKKQREIEKHIIDEVSGLKAELMELRKTFSNAYLPSPSYVPEHIVVSLTTYPARFNSVCASLRTLINQTLKADRIVVYLDCGIQDITDEMRSFIAQGIEYRFNCENLLSHKKYYYAFREFPESLIITVDDDLLYPNDMIETLYRSYRNHPDCISARRVHRLRFSEDGKSLPYSQRIYECKTETEPSHELFATTGAGTLFPPHLMHKETLNSSLFLSLCPTSDDIWLKFMALLSNVKIVWAANSCVLPPAVPDSQYYGLYKINDEHNQNNVQIMKMIERFGHEISAININGLAVNVEKHAVNTEENRELISVIINVYNGEKFIDKCLKSIVNQTYKNLEIIVVNDGSTDQTLDIVKAYEDERIRIINQKNMGLSLARNVGIENAHGEYLFFVDADDFVTTDAVEYLYNIAKEKNVLMSACKTLVIHSYDYTLNQEPENIELISAKEMIKKIFLSLDRAGSIWNKIIKKELFDNIRFEDRVINDVVVMHKLYLQAETVAFGSRTTYFYLKHPDAITCREPEERSRDYYLGAKERYEYIKKIYPNFWENEICMYFSITETYLNRNENIRRFLKDEGAFKYYNKIFRLRNMFHKMNSSTRMKYILFRISPKLCLKAYNFYIKRRNK